MAKPTFIVHGPMGCGKTHNREAIAKKLVGDPNAYVDEFDCRHDRMVPGKVYLTTQEPTGSERETYLRRGIRIVAFKTLGFPKSPLLERN